MKNTILCLLMLCAPILAQEAQQPQAAPAAKPEAAKSHLPIHLGIVMLASKMTFPQQQAAASELVQNLIKNSGDEAFVISAGGEKMWPYPRLEWEKKSDNLVKFIKSLDKNTGMPDAFEFRVNMGNGGNFRSWTTTFGGQEPQQSVFGVVAQMMASDPQPARHVVILFRDPWSHSKGYGSAYGRSGDFTRKVDDRLNWVIGAYKQLGITAYVIGLDDPLLKPHMESEIGATYGGSQGGSAGLRQFDEEARKMFDKINTDGRTNLDRIANETGGIIVYSAKKNYSDAVKKFEEALVTSDATASGK